MVRRMRRLLIMFVSWLLIIGHLGATLSLQGSCLPAWPPISPHFPQFGTQTAKNEAVGLYYLRARYMNAANGRFWNADSYEGSSADPASLHKYLYANADPMNGYDPSGYFSVSEFATVGAIIGGLAGGTYGFIKAYRKTQKIFSLETFVSTLGYAVAGATLGAELGSIVAYLGGTTAGLSSGGVFSTIIKMTPKLITQLVKIARNRSLIYTTEGALKSLTALSFAAGLVSGVIAAIATPGEYSDPGRLTVNSIYGGGHMLEVGYTWLVDNFSVPLPRTPGGAQLALVYTTGFALGYNATSLVKDAIQDDEKNTGDLNPAYAE